MHLLSYISQVLSLEDTTQKHHQATRLITTSHILTKKKKSVFNVFF